MVDEGISVGKKKMGKKTKMPRFIKYSYRLLSRLRAPWPLQPHRGCVVVCEEFYEKTVG